MPLHIHSSEDLQFFNHAIFLQGFFLKSSLAVKVKILNVVSI